MADVAYPIKAVVQRTGLSAHVIRVWERRYDAVRPERTATNRRVYSAKAIERLVLLRELTTGGQSISSVARLPTEQLKRLAAESPTRVAANAAADRGAEAARLIARGVAAVRTLQASELEGVLADAEAALGVQGMLQRVVSPLAQAIGELWRDGTITAAHEHFASAVFRTVLGNAIRPYALSDQAPVVVVATPAGQLHEVGALIAGAAAANLGWRVVYLGVGLPGAEIAIAARRHGAKLVALSLVYPEDDPRLGEELRRLRDALLPETAVVAGGRAVPAYAEALAKAGITSVDDLTKFGNFLDALRRPLATH